MARGKIVPRPRPRLTAEDYRQGKGLLIGEQKVYGTMEITVDKRELLKKLEENRSKHRTVFLDALQGYREELQTILEEKINSLMHGKIPNINIPLVQPEDHTRDYDRVISMLKMHQGDTFTIDYDTYAQYVDDDWNWKRQWLTTATAYAAGSVAANYGG